MTEKLTPFDAAEYLESEEDVAVFLNEAFATGNPGYIAHANRGSSHARKA